MSSPDQITAPWDKDTVRALNTFQRMANAHPFTCGNQGDEAHPDGQSDLVATKDGWICPYCDYRQAWAWANMAAVGSGILAQRRNAGLEGATAMQIFLGAKPMPTPPVPPVERLIRFQGYLPRSSPLIALHVVSETEWDLLQRLIATDHFLHFGEVAGKHSEVNWKVEAHEVEVLSTDPQEIAFFRKLGLSGNIHLMGHAREFIEEYHPEWLDAGNSTEGEDSE